MLKVEVENWMSFRDRAVFTMLASKERQHSERIARLPKYFPAKVLPIAAIYGGKASGKSNFCKAIHFAKELVVSGAQPEVPIAIQPYRLDDEAAQRTCRFLFQILVADVLYEFSFAVTAKAVVERFRMTCGRRSRTNCRTAERSGYGARSL